MAVSVILLLLSSIIGVTLGATSCGYPGAPAHSSLTFSAPKLYTGVVATYACETGFELLGPARRVCTEEGKWSPEGIPFCVLNVAAGKAPMQSSVAGTGVPQKAVDGSAASFFNAATCTLTQPERAPWWYVNLLEPYMVQLVRLDFGRPCCGENQVANIVVRVGNNRPDLGVNPVCNKFTGVIKRGSHCFYHAIRRLLVRSFPSSWKDHQGTLCPFVKHSSTPTKLCRLSVVHTFGISHQEARQLTMGNVTSFTANRPYDLRRLGNFALAEEDPWLMTATPRFKASLVGRCGVVIVVTLLLSTGSVL